MDSADSAIPDSAIAWNDAIACPHCRAANPPGGAFCESCGKALPSPYRTGPRVVRASTLPATTAGHALYDADLLTLSRRAANTLVFVGIFQIVVGTVVRLLLNAARGGLDTPSQVLLNETISCVIGVIFIGLSFWARRSPLPASIVGLVLYSTLIAMNVFYAVVRLRSGHSIVPGHGLGVGVIDIVIIVFLIRGIQGALARRRLLETRAAGL